MTSKPCNFLRMLGSSLERVNDNFFCFTELLYLLIKNIYLACNLVCILEIWFEFVNKW